jgi:hypothetical protein
MSGTIEVWERQPNEPQKSFKAFTVYRDLGLDRSLSKAAEKLDVGKMVLGRISRKFGWVSRCAAYDAYSDKIKLDAKAEKIRRDVLDMDERQAKDAMAFQRALATPLIALSRIIHDTNKREKLIEELQGLSAPDLLNLIQKMSSGYQNAAKLERLSRQAPTEITQTELPRQESRPMGCSVIASEELNSMYTEFIAKVCEFKTLSIQASKAEDLGIAMLVENNQ